MYYVLHVRISHQAVREPRLKQRWPSFVLKLEHVIQCYSLQSLQSNFWFAFERDVKQSIHDSEPSAAVSKISLQHHTHSLPTVFIMEFQNPHHCGQKLEWFFCLPIITSCAQQFMLSLIITARVTTWTFKLLNRIKSCWVNSLCSVRMRVLHHIVFIRKHRWTAAIELF